MKMQTAMDLAKGRDKLAALLGVAPITTYRWPTDEDLPAKHLRVLKLARPKWFKAASAPSPADSK